MSIGSNYLIAFSCCQDILLSALTYFDLFCSDDGTLHLGRNIETTYGSMYLDAHCNSFMLKIFLVLRSFYYAILTAGTNLLISVNSRAS